MDLIEPDLVITKDGFLVCMHDVELSTTTNVADFPEFADRRRSITFKGGKTLTGWIVSDFALEEVKKLRVKQRVAFPGRDHFTDGDYQIVTLDEMIAFVQERNKEFGTTAGLYIEMKHTPFFNDQGLFFEQRLIDTLVKFGYEIFDPVEAKKTNVLIQSFDPSALKRLRSEYKVHLKFVQLVDEPDWFLEDNNTRVFGDLVTADGLDEITTYAEIVAPWKRFFYTFDEAVMARLNWTMYRGSEIVQEARKRGLEVHTWTVRNKFEDATTRNIFGGSSYRGASPPSMFPLKL
jgi:glycerophosphoryl diester phosphodiesterase